MKQSKLEAAKIALFYLAIGVLWIILSDRLAYLLTDNNIVMYDFFQRYKGWFFILVTSIFLFFIIYFRSYKLFISTSKLEKTTLQLEKSTEHYQSLFRHNPDAIFEIDMQGKINSINPKGEVLLGYSKEEIEGKSFIPHIVQEENEKIEKYYEMALKGKPYQYEKTFTNRMGERILLKSTIFPIYVNSEIVGVFEISRDITELRKHEEMLDQTEKMSLIGQLAAGLAHEIRNPLTSIKGFVQLIKEGTSLSVPHINIMIDEIDRINLIVSEMLVLGKQEEVRYKQKDLLKILKDVVVFMEGQAHLTNVTLTLSINAIDNVQIHCDENQIKQLFINIIKNGIEAMPLGGMITINVFRSKEIATIKVTDNGVGISNEHIQQLGEPFFSTKEKGTGLGLVISKRIVTQHGGSMEFQSEKDRGTTVIVRIPLAK
jgi:PAS domain S-box-containing protein